MLKVKKDNAEELAFALPFFASRKDFELFYHLFEIFLLELWNLFYNQIMIKLNKMCTEKWGGKSGI